MTREDDGGGRVEKKNPVRGKKPRMMRKLAAVGGGGTFVGDEVVGAALGSDGIEGRGSVGACCGCRRGERSWRKKLREAEVERVEYSVVDGDGRVVGGDACGAGGWERGIGKRRESWGRGCVRAREARMDRPLKRRPLKKEKREEENSPRAEEPVASSFEGKGRVAGVSSAGREGCEICLRGRGCSVRCVGEARERSCPMVVLFVGSYIVQ